MNAQAREAFRGAASRDGAAAEPSMPQCPCSMLVSGHPQQRDL
jgi:hypothetical protein